MKKFTLPCMLLVSQLLIAQNQQPVISNVSFQLTGNNTLVIQYDLEDAENDPISVSFKAGKSGANELNYATSNATGDLGAGILPGTNKQIQWDYSDYAAQATDEFRLLVVADDLQTVDIQSLVDQVDSLNLLENMEMVEGIRHRTAGSAHLQQVKDLIDLSFINNGLNTYFQEFQYGASYTAHNIIGQQIGTENGGQTYILDGHYDTVDDAPGADDNGSAVVGVLEAMRILSKYPTKKSIKYIGFDLEEDGLVGSKRYVQNGGIASDESIQGVINFEMIGYYSEAPNTQSFPFGFNILFPDVYNEVASQDFKGNFITNVGKVGNSATLMQQYKTAANTYVPGLRVINVEAPSPAPLDLSRSDHASFWVAGIPAIMLTDGAEYRNPNYHTPNDELETLNFSFMTNVVKAAVATLAEVAEVQHADVWWSDTQLFTPTNEKFGCKMELSPNPTNRVLKIDWKGCDSPQLSIVVLDPKGRALLSRTVVNQQEVLDLNGFASGLYFVKIKNSKGQQVIEKLVID